MCTFSHTTVFPSRVFLISLFCLPLLRHGGADLPFYKMCGSTGNYTANSTYESNLRQLLPSLSPAASASADGFSTAAAGKSSDQAFGLALCRGDINATDCRTCVDGASKDILQACPYDKTAFILFYYCLLKYADQNFTSIFDDPKQLFFLWNVNNATFPGYTQNTIINSFYSQAVDTLLSGIVDSAAASNSSSGKLFATGELNTTNGFPTIYGLAQCIPHVSVPECGQCLQGLANQTLKLFGGRQGGQILGSWCYLRYEVYLFYQGKATISLFSIAPQDLPSPPPPSTRPGGSPPRTAPPSPENSTKRPRSKILIIVITTSLALLLSSSLLCLVCIKRQRRAGKTKMYGTRPAFTFNTDEVSKLQKGEESNSEFSLFDFATLVNSTNNFSIQNKLGEGGFGPVYKGQLSNGLEIAVKRLSTRSGQGLLEFNNEIRLIAKLQHRNLVKLLGCCIQGEEKILIYEYMPNKSLDFFLFDRTIGAQLDWQKRFTIVEGIAQGLLYLHKHSRLRIIHRDLKASNILLDCEMNPKISDFGLARIFDSNETQANTRRVVGTYGYISPEYASEGLFSVKSDVFSFGVLLLEIVCGKRNAGFHQYGNHLNLLGYAWEAWKEGKWCELIDPSLNGSFETNEILGCIYVALLCVQENAVDRPTMSNVIAMLNSDITSLPDPKQPAYFNVRIKDEAEMASDFIMPVTENEITFTSLEGR